MKARISTCYEWIQCFLKVFAFLSVFSFLSFPYSLTANGQQIEHLKKMSSAAKIRGIYYIMVTKVTKNLNEHKQRPPQGAQVPSIYLGNANLDAHGKSTQKKRRRRGEGQKPKPKGKTKRKRKCYHLETLSMREHPSRLITNNMQPQKRHASRPAKGPRTYN